VESPGSPDHVSEAQVVACIVSLDEIFIFEPLGEERIDWKI